jgi:hypothetical protein
LPPYLSNIFLSFVLKICGGGGKRRGLKKDRERGNGKRKRGEMKRKGRAIGREKGLRIEGERREGRRHGSR